MLVFVLACGCLLGAPLLFSNFWEVTHDLAPQALFSALGAVVALLLALCPRPRNEAISSTRSSLHGASANYNTSVKPKASFLSAISWPTRCLMAFFAWCVLSFAASVYQHDALLELARLLTAAAWFLVLRELLKFRASHDENTDSNRVLDIENSAANAARISCDWRAVFVLLAATLGLVAVCIPALVNFFNTRDPRQFGTFFNPNLFANASAMTLPLSFGATLGAWRLARRKSAALTVFVLFCGAILSLLVFGGLAVTSSKGGFLAALAALFVFVVGLWRAQNVTIGRIWRANRVLVSLSLLLVLGVGGALAAKTVLPRLAQARGGDDNSTMFRAYTWKSTLKMAETRPVFGFGPGGFSQAHDRFAIVGTTRSAHQSWLQIAAEHGLPALFLLIATSALFLRRGWRALQTRSWPQALAAMSAVVAFAVHGLTDSGWGISSILLLLMTAFALLDAADEAADEPDSTATNIEYSKRDFSPETSLETTRQIAPEVSRLRWSWLTAVAIVGAASWLAQRASAGEDARALADEALRRGDANSALQQAQQAVESDPLSARQQQFLAQIHASLGDASGAETAFSRAAALDSQSSAPWRSWAVARAQNRISSARNAPSTAQLWQRAIENAPRETAIRLARAKWLLAQNPADKQAQRDLEIIVGERDAPYGKYPAIGDSVNLDFARAALMLAPFAAKNGDQTRAKTLLEIARTDLSRAQSKLAQQQKVVATGVDVPESLAPPADLDALQTQFTAQREMLKKEAK